MLSVGNNLLSQIDALKKVKVDYLYHSLRNPKPEIRAKIVQLRIIRNLDSKQYTMLKRQLPYVVCASFKPPYRRTENFAYTEYFIMDIDHLYEKGIDLQQVRQKIQMDNRVMLCFLSPSEDGLKVLFRLKERCYDAGLYSLFYKAFLKNFSKQYGLEQAIDDRTSDVCRACFISVDGKAYYNSSAEPVDMNSYLQCDDVNSLFELRNSFVREMKEVEEVAVRRENDTEPDSEVIQRVKLC